MSINIINNVCNNVCVMTINSNDINSNIIINIINVCVYYY